MSTTKARSKVPFSPVPCHPQPVKFRASDTWTHIATPLRELWEDNYRRASLALLYGNDEEARRLARTGIDMEDAYLQRARDEYRREQEATR